MWCLGEDVGGVCVSPQLTGAGAGVSARWPVACPPPVGTDTVQPSSYGRHWALDMVVPPTCLNATTLIRTSKLIRLLAFEFLDSWWSWCTFK